MLRIAVLVSGGGTNLQAIIDAIAAGKITDTEIAAVISNNKNAYALERAKQAGIKDIVVSPKDFETREVFNENLLKTLQEVNPNLIVLAGYLVVIPESVIDVFENRIINIHPSLIPAFCGTGYYGLKVHEAALKRGVKVVGATVHFVDKGTDTGPIIMQKAVAVQNGDTPKVLQQRVMEQAEWNILPAAIDKIAHGKVRIEDKTIPIAKKHGISRMCLFGSYARGEANDDSDVDLYVDKGKMTSLIKYMAFVYDLEDELQCHVDVVTTGIKDKIFLDNIQNEGVVLYEE